MPELVHHELTTPWKVDQPIPLPEYPRPQLVRGNWQNLNGWWDCAIRNLNAPQPAAFEEKILVPYAPESRLSGVEHVLQPDEKLWYRRTFVVSHDEDEVVLLHFDAVDFACELWLNSSKVGEHWGGYLPFDFDITTFLVEGENELVLSVTDATEADFHQKGKQRLKPGGIWYSAVSGIWQTVWLEVMPSQHIHTLKLTPNLDASNLLVEVALSGTVDLLHAELEAIASFEGQEVTRASITSASQMLLHIPDPKKWHPDHPYLYDLIVKLKIDGAVVDEVGSYFGMRKFGKTRDGKGFWRFTLNDEPIFQFGPLDQGYFPEGLYTAPSEEAMLFDIEYAKKIGCNMIRKHVKVEPARWYYACDRLGMIVWQDMPNGGRTTKDAIVAFTFTSGVHRSDIRRLHRFGREDSENREEYRQELKHLIDSLYHFPCIAVWVPFNESWGQFHAILTSYWVKGYDPTRLVDHASGWFDQGGGDFQSRHVYVKALSASQPDERILAVTEFGGYTLQVDGHVYTEKKRFGYGHYQDAASLTAAYLRLLEEQVKPLIPLGLSVTIYTQTTDIETEINGYLTYDRKVEKMDPNILRQAHLELYQTMKE
ncbi:MAG TPA: glycoside hydrolase family 2 TIM barrel-domain containing protein [Anaerolineaceae bacterium]|nr:glycoside hydrolase family 2 TIM barrel-domain containing protein [Anaerolineaceae bacterium]